MQWIYSGWIQRPLICRSKYNLYSGGSQDFFGGGTLFQKILSKNIQKIFTLYSKNFQIKNKQIFKNIWKILKNFQNFLKSFTKFSKNFRKFLKIFLRKLWKMHYFSRFFTKFKKLCIDFCAFGRKSQCIGNFEKIFQKFEKFSSENCYKCIILAHFSKKLTNHALIFCAFGRKNYLQKIFEKILKNFLQKIAKMHYFSIFSKKI